MALFFVALNAASKAIFEDNLVLRCAWFGSAGNMIPIKRSGESAIWYFQEAGGMFPMYVLCFTMPFEKFFELVDCAQMVAKFHLNGYRVYRDLLVEGKGWAHNIEFSSRLSLSSGHGACSRSRTRRGTSRPRAATTS